MKKVFIFMGPPGAGKGTLSQLCVKNMGLTQLSTGFLCRKHIAENTETGKKIDFAIKSGKLISDSIIIDMVEQWLIENLEQWSGVILDGFPRTVSQAQALNNFLRVRLSHCELQIVKLFISDNVVIERLSGRTVCSNKECQAVFSRFTSSALIPKDQDICDVCSSPLGRRKDDELETVRERLVTYHKTEKDLVDYFQKAGAKVTEMNVEKPLDQVFEEFKRIASC